MAVDRRNHVPAVGFETLRGVVAEPAFDLAVDGNAVVVVQHDQLRQAQRAGQRTGFVRNAFHQAAVADEGVSIVIDHVQAGLVEFGGQQFFGQRHAHGVGEALTQRAGGGFDARRDVDFRMARGLGMQLAELFQIFHRQVVACEVQQRILQHRTVAVRQHEAVAIGPFRICRIMAIVAGPQSDSDIGHSHRHAWVAGIGLLNCIHCQGANRVGHFFCGKCRCHIDVKWQ